MISNELTKLKRIEFNLVFQIRMSNQDEIEKLKLLLKSKFDTKNRILLDEKVRYDQELKSELIELDEFISHLSGIIK